MSKNDEPKPKPITVKMTIDVSNGAVAVRVDPPETDLLVLSQAFLGVTMNYIQQVQGVASMLIDPNKKQAPPKGENTNG